jgi:hypothetical protein
VLVRTSFLGGAALRRVVAQPPPGLCESAIAMKWISLLSIARQSKAMQWHLLLCPWCAAGCTQQEARSRGCAAGSALWDLGGSAVEMVSFLFKALRPACKTRIKSVSV